MVGDPATTHVAAASTAGPVGIVATAALVATAVGLTVAVDGHPATLAAAGLIAGTSLSGSI